MRCIEQLGIRLLQEAQSGRYICAQCRKNQAVAVCGKALQHDAARIGHHRVANDQLHGWGRCQRRLYRQFHAREKAEAGAQDFMAVGDARHGIAQCLFRDAGRDVEINADMVGRQAIPFAKLPQALLERRQRKSAGDICQHAVSFLAVVRWRDELHRPSRSGCGVRQHR